MPSHIFFSGFVVGFGFVTTGFRDFACPSRKVNTACPEYFADTAPSCPSGHLAVAERVPFAIEAPFALVLGGQVVRGRIDAVYEDDGGFLVVDWKTNRAHTADPLQLAVYRLAWAELRGVPLERVRAAFHYVRDGETVAPADLPDREALEKMVR